MRSFAIDSSTARRSYLEFEGNGRPLVMIDGASPDWRRRFIRHPAQKAFLFGERSLPDRDVEDLPFQGIRVSIVAAAGHSMGLENPSGLAAVIAEATA